MSKSKYSDGINNPIKGSNSLAPRVFFNEREVPPSTRDLIASLSPVDFPEDITAKLISDLELYRPQLERGMRHIPGFTLDDAEALFVYTYECYEATALSLNEVSNEKLLKIMRKLKGVNVHGACVDHVQKHNLDGAAFADTSPERNMTDEKIRAWFLQEGDALSMMRARDALRSLGKICLADFDCGTSHKNQIYGCVNRVMRESDELLFQEGLRVWAPWIHRFCIALEKIPPSALEVFRGINIDFDYQKYSPGNFYSWPAFSSTSASKAVGKDFAKKKGGTGRGTLFIAYVSSARDISIFSKFPEEAEFLLPPNRFFVVRQGMTPTMMEMAECEQIIVVEETKPEGSEALERLNFQPHARYFWSRHFGLAERIPWELFETAVTADLRAIAEKAVGGFDVGNSCRQQKTDTSLRQWRLWITLLSKKNGSSAYADAHASLVRLIAEQNTGDARTSSVSISSFEKFLVQEWVGQKVVKFCEKSSISSEHERASVFVVGDAQRRGDQVWLDLGPGGHISTSNVLCLRKKMVSTCFAPTDTRHPLLEGIDAAPHNMRKYGFFFGDRVVFTRQRRDNPYYGEHATVLGVGPYSCFYVEIRGRRYCLDGATNEKDLMKLFQPIRIGFNATLGYTNWSKDDDTTALATDVQYPVHMTNAVLSIASTLLLQCDDEARHINITDARTGTIALHARENRDVLLQALSDSEAAQRWRKTAGGLFQCMAGSGGGTQGGEVVSVRPTGGATRFGSQPPEATSFNQQQQNSQNATTINRFERGATPAIASAIVSLGDDKPSHSNCLYLAFSDVHLSVDGMVDVECAGRFIGGAPIVMTPLPEFGGPSGYLHTSEVDFNTNSFILYAPCRSMGNRIAVLGLLADWRGNPIMCVALVEVITMDVVPEEGDFGEADWGTLALSLCSQQHSSVFNTYYDFRGNRFSGVFKPLHFQQNQVEISLIIEVKALWEWGFPTRAKNYFKPDALPTSASPKHFDREFEVPLLDDNDTPLHRLETAGSPSGLQMSTTDNSFAIAAPSVVDDKDIRERYGVDTRIIRGLLLNESISWHITRSKKTNAHVVRCTAPVPTNTSVVVSEKHFIGTDGAQYFLQIPRGCFESERAIPLGAYSITRPECGADIGLPKGTDERFLPGHSHNVAWDVLWGSASVRGGAKSSYLESVEMTTATPVRNYIPFRITAWLLMWGVLNRRAPILSGTFSAVSIILLALALGCSHAAGGINWTWALAFFALYTPSLISLALVMRYRKALHRDLVANCQSGLHHDSMAGYLILSVALPQKIIIDFWVNNVVVDDGSNTTLMRFLSMVFYTMALISAQYGMVVAHLMFMIANRTMLAKVNRFVRATANSQLLINPESYWKRYSKLESCVSRTRRLYSNILQALVTANGVFLSIMVILIATLLLRGESFRDVYHDNNFEACFLLLAWFLWSTAFLCLVLHYWNDVPEVIGGAINKRLEELSRLPGFDSSGYLRLMDFVREAQPIRWCLNANSLIQPSRVMATAALLLLVGFLILPQVWFLRDRGGMLTLCSYSFAEPTIPTVTFPEPTPSGTNTSVNLVTSNFIVGLGGYVLSPKSSACQATGLCWFHTTNPLYFNCKDHIGVIHRAVSGVFTVVAYPSAPGYNETYKIIMGNSTSLLRFGFYCIDRVLQKQRNCVALSQTNKP
eukprot:PhM_4_TR18811/c0_g1_i1/m.89183